MRGSVWVVLGVIFCRGAGSKQDERAKEAGC